MIRQPVVEALDAAVHLLVLLPAEAHVEAGRPELTEFQDARPRFVRHAEDVADHRDRKLRAILLHDVDRPRINSEGVEQPVGGVLHAISQCRNGSGGEHR